MELLTYSYKPATYKPAMRVTVDLTSDGACAAALEKAVGRYGIYDTDTWKAVLQDDAANFARCLCEALCADGDADRADSEQAPLAKHAILEVEDVSTQTTEDMIDVSTAEAMMAEAVQINDHV